MPHLPQPDSNPVKTPLEKRKQWLLIFLMVIVIAAMASATWWYFNSRNVQSTDDAYVMGNQVTISSQVNGSVVSVNYTNTDLVQQGDVLVNLDDTDANLNFKKVKNKLAETVRKTKQIYVNDAQYNANIAQAKIAYQQAQADYQRRTQLMGAGAFSKEDLQHARNAVSSSKAALDVAIEQYRSNRTLIQNSTLEQQPAILLAAEQMREAWLALQRTKIRSPVTGYVAQRNVQVGETLSAGQALLSIVPADQLWIDANFKETQLSGVRIGQKVSVVSDLYGSNVVFDGVVEGINMGTGGAFSVLPAQNATGNWIKVVQRLPVRITLDAEQLKAYPLRIGLSTTVTLRENNTNGPALSTTQRQKPAYQSQALVLDTSSIDQEIQDIIKANAM
ncbi:MULTISPECIES: EmrA/EmrK family multidrug efflux transporter periplasmic adaptor subunit [Serratia]|uniref:EmrA/EmrK family multidrug efflux transporter periplasmic adaptor subunit n=1 Tax=Serratia fonticola TaxID=47917 RepID=A0ABY9PQW5_SERFO|nr:MULTISPECIES: EmrA/EmrK family multidrug efflux transporter periplasmic adaptor subunit [Serratia]ATM75148.1 EmrA/EmrK family multidrug efflux transporter periplasmic adaptor subunit [Serratia fonticola]MCO7510519.1 EmrA/EmrK family multidrug efflux transporter periplasmic adaptor subunit [Serratia fonticola]NCG55085.1 EmrA/EmrK family multidrug efflux transporter periplasmic adaptor subunit [Serratia fonticola]OCJ42181.1 multidrug export protein EmrA [Serratia sp. 14-2641]OKP27304.1 multid